MIKKLIYYGSMVVAAVVAMALIFLWVEMVYPNAHLGYK